MSRKRIVNLSLLLAGMVLISALSWLAGSRIVSPAEAAARTAPPTPSPILVPVESRTLSSDIVTRGTARYGLPQSIAMIPSTLKAGIGIITTLPQRSTQLNEGDVLLTTSGRPLFVLLGRSPAYRDLVPGIRGNDVLQLEEALARLGFDPGAIDGFFDASTSAAIHEWYRAAGWEAFEPTPEQVRNLRTLEQEFAIAENNKLAAEDGVASARLAVKAARDSATSANQAAEADVETKNRANDRVVSDPNSTGDDRANAAAALAVAETTLIATRSQGEASIQAAVDALRVAEREVERLIKVAERAASDLEVAQRKTGVQIPIDEIVFVPSLPIRVGQIYVAVGDAASGPVLTVTNNQLAIDSSLPLAEAPLVKQGMTVFIDEPDLGIQASGVVTRVAETPGTFGVDGYHIYFETIVDETPLGLEGVSLRLTIPVNSTGGNVLAVPISALSMTVDGSSRVQIEREGELVYVDVEPGLSADGFVQVTPISGTLEAGQMVLVGYEKL